MLPRPDDRMRRIVAKARHEDHGQMLVDLLELIKTVKARHIGEANISEDRVVMKAADHDEGFLGIVGRLYLATVTPQQFVRGTTHPFVGINDEDPLSAQEGALLPRHE